MEQGEVPPGASPVRLEDDALTWAARLLVRGINPIPLNGKMPAVPWKRFQHERLIDRDIDELDAYLLSWWADTDHGLGVVTGSVSGLVVVDVDSPEAREFVETTCGGWPTTTEVETARGCHLYFSHPGGDLANRAHVADVPLDVRANGGFVVTAPSQHPSGVRYRWVRWTDTPFPPMPERLRELLWPTPRPRVAVRRAPKAPSSGRYVETALERELAAVRSAAPGTRNDTLNRSAHAIARFVPTGQLPEADLVQRFLEAALAAGLSQREAEQTIRSALRGRT